ncbi:MAG TPA: Asp-tRNA(Asn)/Glu-tRNA(Gln) amidotransferase subunit GatB [Nitrospiraceae bacterium]|nr:MAG: asparaginyl/glutamyl-tRNA amidotransferase subunit C [Nitrospirae bacterium GWA2_46_11]OGW26096.1 MAG: asparaginyl/glutamyl-tRNA amidotransferase subunit C [Nitrospirae bacterium GWB2_47_37]HAK89450.1 Asp-tRNA(Asn)/Glu-tRNA(Gln) amidotransferase subunit GatB [Nitrospiraceae bacterium]HCZ11692.1 Asp-tRNA(Asn)/Glu-tRNA(Gln) amidotransferase subunit GatB [Nitrospiraceae bacterium]
MKITQEDVKHIARLSRLYLSDEETGTFGGQLNSIIEYVEQLSGLDTSNVEPTSHVIPLNNVMRDDTMKPSLPVEEALKNAADATEKFYRVPKIIE